MDGLEQAIGFMFGQATPDQHQWAVSFCNDFVDSNHANWAAFFDYLESPGNPELIRFFFLQALTDIVKSRFAQ